MTAFTALACLAYLAWLVREKRRARRDRAALRHVIHVNGIRGKSSVSRLIDAGLRAGGWRVFTKTIGTCPATIGVDGAEKPLPRRGKPSIKEQLRILRLAADQRADVLVIECMAVLPEYQKTSEEDAARRPRGHHQRAARPSGGNGGNAGRDRQRPEPHHPRTRHTFNI